MATKTRGRRTAEEVRRLYRWNDASWADNKDYARLNITFSCDNDECQTLEELDNKWINKNIIDNVEILFDVL